MTDFDGWDDDYTCSDGDEDNLWFDGATLAVQIGRLPLGTKVHQLRFNFPSLTATCYDADGDCVALQKFTLTPVN